MTTFEVAEVVIDDEIVAGILISSTEYMKLQGTLHKDGFNNTLDYLRNNLQFPQFSVSWVETVISRRVKKDKYDFLTVDME